MKSRPRFILPGPGSSEFAPALATGVLILLLALQLALPYATDLPPDSGLAPRRPHVLKAPALASFPALSQNDLFDPSRQKGGGSADDIAAMGAFSSGRGSAVLLKAPGSAARFVRPGQSLAGWKLVSIGRDAAWVQKGDLKRRLAFGASPAPTLAASPAAPTPPAEDAAE